VGGECQAAADLSPEKIQYPLYRGLSGHQSRSKWVRQISPAAGSDPRTIQPIASWTVGCIRQQTVPVYSAVQCYVREYKML